MYYRLKDIDIESNMHKKIGITFLLKKAEVAKQRDGGDFMTLTVKDIGVEAKARVFSVDSAFIDRMKAGSVYDAYVKIDEYNSKPSLIISMKEITESCVRPEQFIEWEDNVNIHMRLLEQAMGMVKGTVYGSIANTILDEEFEKFKYYPAATGMHHTAFGGLMAHTANVARSSFTLAQVYNDLYGSGFVNEALVISGALVHDVGKVMEFKVDTVNGLTEYSTESVLMTHIVYGIRRISETAAKLGYTSGDNRRMADELIHVVSSHHGRLEWGSPQLPHMIESEIVHRADELDADAWRYNKNFKKLKKGESVSEWGSSGISSYYRPVKQMRADLGTMQCMEINIPEHEEVVSI